MSTLSPLRILLILVLSPQALAGAGESDTTAKEILQLSGAKAGLCVHLECGDGRLLGELARSGGFLVHGLSSDATAAAAARKRLAGEGLAGIAGVEALPLDRLPYADNLVNLLVADDLPGLIEKGLKPAEILRVLCPDGAACLGVSPAKRQEIERQLAKAGIEDIQSKKGSRQWLVFTKPRPAGMDDWTHWNHGPDGNPVSQDQLIERPNQLQWIAGPQWWGHRGRRTPTASGQPIGMLSANGRNYYIEGTSSWVSAGYQLVARDAFNGVLLWAQDIKDLKRTRLVASGDEVYLYREGEIVALDAATGKDVRSYGKAAGCRQLLLAQGLLLSFESGNLQAFDAAAGKRKWSSPEGASARYPVVKDGKLFFRGRGGLACMDLAGGTVNWRRPAGGEIVFAFNDMVLLRAGTKGTKTKYGLQYTAVSAKVGEEVWSHTRDRPDGRYVEAYFAGGLVWIQSHDERKDRKTDGFHNPKGGVSYRWEGLDPDSGKVTRSFLAPVMLSYACYQHWATDRFQIGIRPIYFTEWKTGKVSRFEATRQACQSNHGLGHGMFFGIYVSPEKCICVRPAMAGVTAFTSDGKTIDGEVKTEEEGRLLRGPATAPESAAAPSGDEWPMYRHDMRRSAGTAGKIPAEQLAPAWRSTALPGQSAAGESGIVQCDWLINKPTGDPVTQPTVAEGKVFVSCTHAQQVVALDEPTGEVAWRFFAPARLDTPPTIHRGLCLFGCNDGWVYCLRSDDGKLVWRFRAAPSERRIVAYGQVESAWPVVGGVLIVADHAYVVAGRTTEADGGLYVHALKVKTGKPLWSGRRVKPDDGPVGGWNLRGHKNDYFGPSDVLCSDGRTVAMAGHPCGRFHCKDGRKVSDWSFGVHFGWMRSQYARQMKTQYAPVAFSGRRTVSSRRIRDPKTKKTHQYVGKTELLAPMRLEALAVAGELAVAAISSGPDSPGGELWVLSAKGGDRLATHKLPAAPAFDGVAITGGKVYLALQDGTVMCLGRK